MRTKPIRAIAAAILTSMMMLSSCYHDADLSFVPPKPEPDPSIGCSQDVVYFQNTVLPLVMNSCGKSGCHDQATQKAEVVLTDYNNIVSHIVPFDPQSSELYTMLFSNSDGRMPPDGPLTMNQKSIIYWWIMQGGYNNRCDSALCDTTDITYGNTLKPILDTWCIGCHSGSQPEAGYSLDTYTGLVDCANSGRLMGAIKHLSGYSAMPQGGAMLSSCQINQFQKWIDTGMPQ